MNPLPAYKPRKPISIHMSYNESVKAYGPPPKGYRWLKEGERVVITDIYCNENSWVQMPEEKPFAPVASDETYAFARRIEGTKIVSPLEKLLSRTIRVDNDSSSRPLRLKRALKFLTDAEINRGESNHDLLKDLRDALRDAVRILEKQ